MKTRLYQSIISAMSLFFKQYVYVRKNEKFHDHNLFPSPSFNLFLLEQNTFPPLVPLFHPPPTVNMELKAAATKPTAKVTVPVAIQKFTCVRWRFNMAGYEKGRSVHCLFFPFLLVLLVSEMIVIAGFLRNGFNKPSLIFSVHGVLVQIKVAFAININKLLVVHVVS